MHNFDLEDITDDEGKVYLYSSRVTEQIASKNEKTFVGIVREDEDDYNITFDLVKERLSNVIGNNCVDIFHSEDDFNKIDKDTVIEIINDIYELLKPGGLFRWSLSDYKTDILKSRVVYHSDGNIHYDPGSGSRMSEDNLVIGGAIWFPTIEMVKKMIKQTKFSESNVNYIQYYDEEGNGVLGNIDYSNGYISRTPDHDNRVSNPKRPFSIVIDLVK